MFLSVLMKLAVVTNKERGRQGAEAVKSWRKRGWSRAQAVGADLEEDEERQAHSQI